MADAPDGELQFSELVHNIFSQPPRPPRTILLQLTDDSLNEFSANEEPHQEFFLDLAAAGVQKLFNTRQLAAVTQEDFTLLQQYMNSVGVMLVVHIVNPDGTVQEPWSGDVAEGAKLSMTVRWL